MTPYLANPHDIVGCIDRKRRRGISSRIPIKSHSTYADGEVPLVNFRRIWAHNYFNSTAGRVRMRGAQMEGDESEQANGKKGSTIMFMFYVRQFP